MDTTRKRQAIIGRVEALNYRCLRYISQPLQPFHVLVGANATGKSAFLDVIDFMSDFLKLGLDETILMREKITHSRGRASRADELIFKQSADHFELAIEINIPEALEQSTTNGKYRRARYAVALGLKSTDGELIIQNETLWLTTEANDSEKSPRQISFFPLEPEAPQTLFNVPKKSKLHNGWRKVVYKTDSGNDYFHSETGKWENYFRVGPRKAALANLPEDLSRFPVSIWIRNLLMEGVHFLALNSAMMRRPSSPSLSRTFSVDGSNLPLVVRDLSENHPKVFEEWLEHVRTVLSDVKDIHVQVRQEDRHLYLAIQYASGGEPVPSWLLSDGTLRFLALTLLAYLPEHRGIYLIEEPENGIHPRAIEAVFQSLSSVYDGQVLLATHSPLVLRLAELNQILCFAKNPSGATAIVTGNEHPRLRGWKGQTDLATLYASGVLG